MGCKQAARPDHFANRWTVAGAIFEDPNAGRECEVVCYETDDRGRDVVRVRFIGADDLFDDTEARYTPWQLLPVT